MADPIEEQLKKLNRKQDKIIVLLETLVSLSGGHLPQPPEQKPVDPKTTVSVVPCGRIKPRYSSSEQQFIHPHEREP